MIQSFCSRNFSNLGATNSAGQTETAAVANGLRRLMRAVAAGDVVRRRRHDAEATQLGLLHALIYDDTLRKRVDGTLKNIEGSSASLKDSIDAVKSGDGLMHELIYGQEGARLASDLRGVSKAMTSLLEQIENEESMLNALIYDPESKKIVDNIKEASGKLVRISDELESGSGSAALFLRDPVLYEEIRTLVGGAQRNKLLRAYIRKAIEEAEDQSADSFDTVQQP